MASPGASCSTTPTSRSGRTGTCSVDDAIALQSLRVGWPYSNNKFYMVQLIQDGDTFMVFRKWGRVGAKNPQVGGGAQIIQVCCI